MTQKVSPVKKLTGNLTPPPDKSISHRSALFAAISEEESLIHNYSDAADPASTLKCLTQLGVQIEKNSSTVRINGAGRNGLQKPDQPLDCGNSGTTMRLLGGILAGAGVDCTMIGDESLSSRTMKRIIDPLTRMGCSITGRDGAYAPLNVRPNNGVQGIRFPLPIASAQLKSAVLLTGLFGEKPTEVIESTLSRDHTERLLELQSEPYGTGKLIRSSLDDTIPAQNYSVPGDFSAAAFWLVAGSIQPEANIHLSQVGINPSRIAAYQILLEMGANIQKENETTAGKEPVADLKIQHSALSPIELDPALVPNCIDELPILMVAMCFAEGTSIISGAEELRHKETDRLSAMAEILALSGASTEIKKDGIVIHGHPDFIPRPSSYPSYHDHRMAMAAAVLATRSNGESKIKDADCTAISYPEFWEHLLKLSH